MKSITKFLLFFTAYIFSNSIAAQCNLGLITIEQCDLSSIDGNGDMNPDGIINIYDETGTTPSDGVWSINPEYNVAFNSVTGDLSTWLLENSTTTLTLNEYSFELINTAVCGTTPVRTAQLNLGPYSGVALPRTGTLNVNASGCDADELGFDLFTAFLQDDQIPPPHKNGEWTYTGSSSNFRGFDPENPSVFFADIPDGPSDIDQEVFEFVYRVSGVTPCALQAETTVRIAIVRQVYAGEGGVIDICEDDILAGVYDMDVNLRDAPYLIGEDEGGNWSSLVDPTMQISNAADSEINIRAMYDNLIAGGTNLRFGCENFTFTYTVNQRSAVCEDDFTDVSITIYEELRPFAQTGGPFTICSNDESGDIDLFDLLAFSNESGIDFIYDSSNYVNWRLVSGPSDLGLITQEDYYPIPPGEIPTDFYLGAINSSYQEAGTYVFEYAVSPRINCPIVPEEVCNPYDTSPISPYYCEHPCSVETGLVTIEILPFDSAGLDTSNINICISEEEVDLLSLLTPRSGFPIATTGVWTDTNNEVVSNQFVLPVLDNEQTYTFTYTTTHASSGCVDSAELTFTVHNEPNSGEDNEVRVCSDDLTITLFDQLGGDPDTTGLWIGPFGYMSTDHLGVFDASDETLPILGTGTYTYQVPGNLGCPTPSESTITITIIDPEQIGDDVNETFCILDGRVNLFSLLDNNTVRTGIFEDTDGTNALDADGVLNFDLLPNDENEVNPIFNFRYVVTNSAPCDEASLNVAIQIIDLPEPNIPTQEFCILDAKRLEDIEVDELNFNWYDQLESDIPVIDNPLLLDGQIYYIANVDADGCESERQEVLINILNTGERFENGDLCTLDFQDGVSPNGDNQNDTFAILLEDEYNIPVAFPDFDLKIYNRYGTLVYDGNINTDEFRGESNVSLRLGDDLPSGTYFYIFTPNLANNLPIQGSFYLSR